ncbi:hypothetical protein TKK_0001990 [Trichogramma kaykai]|uniref:chymotrypsin n=1 Tax=Trichogramma kaykai TaxID=54128 RepID=A0ABD2X9Q4_9HYME
MKYKLRLMKLIFLLLCVTFGRAKSAKEYVVNGENAKIGERPFQISLQEGSSHFCGGSIINKNYVLTASHCVSLLKDDAVSNIRIVAGTILHKKPGSVHKIEKIIMHEGYNPSDSYRNDIALIKVVEPFKFSVETRPVPLPKQHESTRPGSRATLSGWGYLHLNGGIPDILQKVNIVVADQNKCREAIDSAERGFTIYPTNICAFNPRRRQGQCSGDSGGPLTVDGKLVGVVSWSYKDSDCASTIYPGVYTRVAEYVDWINKNTQ